MSIHRSALGVLVVGLGALGLFVACDDGGGTDGSTGSGNGSTGNGCATLAETCSQNTDCCGPQLGCVGGTCCVTASQVATADTECCTGQTDNGVCCIGLGGGQPEQCAKDADCCDGTSCDDVAHACCLPAGTPSPGGTSCCTATANMDGKCCSKTPGACPAPGCPVAQTQCETTADCCEGVCEHNTCCRFGNSACTNDLECCSHTCTMGKCT